MKSLKVMSIIGIVISSLGLIGSVILLTESDPDAIIAIAVYGYFLSYSIFAIKVAK